MAEYKCQGCNFVGEKEAAYNHALHTGHIKFGAPLSMSERAQTFRALRSEKFYCVKCKYDNQEAKTQVILTNGEAWNVCEFHERLARLSDIKEIRNILADKEI